MHLEVLAHEESQLFYSNEASEIAHHGHASTPHPAHILSFLLSIVWICISSPDSPCISLLPLITLYQPSPPLFCTFHEPKSSLSQSLCTHWVAKTALSWFCKSSSHMLWTQCMWVPPSPHHIHMLES